MANSLHFLKYGFGYDNMCSWAKIVDRKISLPTKNGKIDFEFMEKMVAELEAHRLAELEAYLAVTGLKNYHLTPLEKQALADLEHGKIKWGGVKIIDLFEVKTSKKRFDANKVEILEYGYPYIVRSALSNGVKGFLNEDSKYLNEKNTISFGQDTATMFYQKQPYFTGDKIKVLKSKSESFGVENAQFFICSMSKPFKSFAWGSSSFNVNIIENQEIKLPIKSDGIDYSYMKLLISAIQKLVIKDVVLYTDRKISLTKQIISKGV